jgi:hypothetical protein
VFVVFVVVVVTLNILKFKINLKFQSVVRMVRDVKHRHGCELP